MGVIERLAEDSELQEEIRLLGGIPLILTLLRYMQLPSNTCSLSPRYIHVVTLAYQQEE